MWGHWLYPGLANQVFNIFLGVSPALVGMALMINRLFDAVSDPVFGWLSDNTRTRFGRRRPYILIGSILAGLGLPMLFFVSPGWGDTHVRVFHFDFAVSKYFWFMLGSSALYIPVMSCFNMPYQSLGAELTPDYHERTSVMSFKNGVQKIPELAMFFALQFTTMHWFFDTKTGKPNLLKGAQVYCSILGVLMIVVGIAVFSLVKERYYVSVAARKQQKISITETLYKTLVCRPFRVQLLMRLSYCIGTSMVGALGYYNTVYYVCHGNLATATKWNTVMGLSGMAFGFLGIPSFALIARRLGKRAGLMCVLSCAILVFIGTWWFYNPSIPWLQIFASGLIAFTGAGFWTLEGSIGVDVIDYDELSSGKRREGAFSSCVSWITKVGMALGVGASGIILSATGFDAKLEGAQTEHSLFMIRFLLATIPIIGLVLSIMALSRFPLTQAKMQEIRAQLEERRGRV
jgi:GPH family glycoside/pentoside/hexuronide:cation symporter